MHDRAVVGILVLALIGSIIAGVAVSYLSALAQKEQTASVEVSSYSNLNLVPNTTTNSSRMPRAPS